MSKTEFHLCRVFICSLFTALVLIGFHAHGRAASPVKINRAVDQINMISDPGSTIQLARNMLFSDRADRDLATETPSNALACTDIPMSFGVLYNDTLSATDCFGSNRHFDRYVFNGSPGQGVRITMRSNTFVTLINLFGPPPAFQDLGAANGNLGGNDSRIDAILPSNGQYLILASSFLQTTTGSYSIMIEPLCPPIGIDPGDTLNGTLANTDCIEFDQFFYDPYFLVASAGQNVSISMNSTSIDSFMSLYDPNNNLIAQDDDSGGNLNALISMAVPMAGTYTIRASSANPFETGPYTISLAGQNVTVSGELLNENGEPICPFNDNKGQRLLGDPCGFVRLFVSCTGGFSGNFDVGSVYSIQIPRNSGQCTITPSTSEFSGAGVTAWGPSSTTVGTTQNTSGVSFTVLGPPVGVTGTINPSAGGVTMRLSLLNTGAEVTNRCTLDLGTRIYSCSLTKYSSYRITPFHPSMTSDPPPRPYPDIVFPASQQNYTMIAAPTLSIASNSVAEGNTGSAVLNLTVNLSIPVNQTVTVNYSTSDAGATAGVDYQPVTNGTVTIAAGNTSGSAPVAIIGDTIVDPGEAFTVTLSNAQGGASIGAGQGTATGTINDDDQGGTMKFSQPTYNFSENVGNALIAVTRSGGVASGVTVICRTTAGGTASPGLDYTTVTQTLTFGANVDSQNCVLPILPDAINDPNETVFVSLDTPTGGGSTGFPTSAEITITNAGAGPGRTLFDYDGDGRSDISVRRPSNDLWYLLRTTAGYTAMTWGVAGDLMVPADYDGDSKTDIAIFRPSIGRWYIVNSLNGTFITYDWGADGDLPAPADHNADGKADLVLFRLSNGTCYRRLSNNSFANTTFGVAGDKPVVGDFDGDGQWDIAVYRPSNNNWYIRKTTVGFFVQTWGEPGDIPVPADYDGDGKTDVAVWRPSIGRWYRVRSTAGFDTVNWGVTGDKPVPADYDGDGKADVAIFRMSNLSWYIVGTLTGQRIQQFGQDGDLPTQASFIY